MSKPTMGSLFAGIGGFDLGFERAGFETKWQVEIDPFCRKVLAKHFPKAERFEDVRTVGRETLRPVDVICGGFPCQDISNAGLRAGIEGERSGLWKEYARIIRELRPKFVVVENVAALLGRGMGVVLGDLASLGYDAEWEIISAADVGAPHLRERVWILAYPHGHGFDAAVQRKGGSEGKAFSSTFSSGYIRSNSSRESNSRAGQAEGSRAIVEGGKKELAYSKGERWGEERELRCQQSEERLTCCCEEMANPLSIRQQGSRESIKPMHPEANKEGKTSNAFNVRIGNHWQFEPALGRVVNGVPVELVADELRGLGNAVVPQIPEIIARRIKEVLDAS